MKTYKDFKDVAVGDKLYFLKDHIYFSGKVENIIVGSHKKTFIFKANSYIPRFFVYNETGKDRAWYDYEIFNSEIDVKHRKCNKSIEKLTKQIKKSQSIINTMKKEIEILKKEMYELGE